MAKALEAGKLIIDAVAVSVDPTGTAAAALGLDTALQLKSWLTGQPDIAKLSQVLDKRFTAKLSEKRFDKPNDARSLLPQMLEKVVLAPDSIAKRGLDADLIFADMKTSVAGLRKEYNDHAILTAFEDLVLQLLREACNDTRLKAAIGPALVREQMKMQRETRDLVQRLVDEKADIARTLHIEEGMLIALARSYGQSATDFESARAGLQLALETASQEKERDALPSNLGQAVDDIVARVAALNDADDLDKADALLLAEMDRRDAERDRQTAEDSRIIDKAIAQALYRADATALADRTLRRIKLEAPSVEDQFHRLRAEREGYYQTGLRLGTPFALKAAIGLAQQCIAIAPTPYLRAMAQNDLAMALRNQGTRTDGPAGTALLAEAVTAYRDALTVTTRADHPVDWAIATQNLAAALRNQGIRTNGPAGTALLAEAVTAYRDALTVFTRADHPVHWATTTQNLALALQNQGIRTDGPAGTALQAKAVTAYRDALTVRTRADHPVDWATTTQNLANTLALQGIRTDGPAGTALLAEAVTAYHDALTVTTRADHPVDWAITTQNLAIALQTQGSRTDGPAGTALLAEAVTAYRDALTVRTRADHPVQWARTQENLAHAERALAQHPATADPAPHWDAALAYVDAALSVFDPDNMSYNHAKATRLRDAILAQQ